MQYILYSFTLVLFAENIKIHKVTQTQVFQHSLYTCIFPSSVSISHSMVCIVSFEMLTNDVSATRRYRVCINNDMQFSDCNTEL